MSTAAEASPAPIPVPAGKLTAARRAVRRSGWWIPLTIVLAIAAGLLCIVALCGVGAGGSPHKVLDATTAIGWMVVSVVSFFACFGFVFATMYGLEMRGGK